MASLDQPLHTMTGSGIGVGNGVAQAIPTIIAKTRERILQNVFVYVFKNVLYRFCCGVFFLERN